MKVFTSTCIITEVNIEKIFHPILSIGKRKGKQWIFSDSVVACDIKVDLCNQPSELLKKVMVINGQGHLLTFVLDTSDSVLFFFRQAGLGGSVECVCSW